ncbi:glutathione S-transferase family protein [Aquisalimonas sp. 2447]|uniref:glutathione S-transferase family protein n=1 Tax=Aquisalimonas sp. 2447 TaxID=2740807 RepID=UPI001432685E|nr:glutathione S-transferase family protein [Aquisalimonas sp. 2447]QIT55133.1 glutathione S-transferase family protein [Aquisalimonas sp. 2447]
MGGRLIDGQWYTQGYEPDNKGRFVRQESVFRERTVDAPGERFRPEAQRYHLYVSYACPWAHRILIMRRLKGLESAISVSVVHPLMLDDGWEFRDYPGSTGDPVHQARYLRDVYVAADSAFTGRVTVPLLWDRREGTIVNNESRELLRMLDHDWNAVATDATDFAPANLIDAVDHTIDAIYEPVNNGVYKCGFAQSQEAYDEAADALYAALDHWDTVLGEQRFLCGDRVTEADICLFTTLVRFDPVYSVHFKCSQRRIMDYPNLLNYLRDLYQRPAFRETTNMDHIRQHYYRSHGFINPTGIVARAPMVDLDAPHGRERFG